MCRMIMRTVARRSAMIYAVHCEHPDIEAFIDAKRNLEKLRMFNLAVRVTDAFMAALKKDDNWADRFHEAVYRTLPARALWDRIMRATY